MWCYTTLGGRHIDLDALTPKEQQVYLNLLYLAGGPKILNISAGLPRPGTGLPDSTGPSAFRSACRLALIREFSDAALEHAANGPLGLILEDLAERINLLKDESLQAEIFNPARFLKRFYEEECSSLTDFCGKTGIGIAHASRLLRDSADLSLSKLRDVASRTGVAFDFVRLSDPILADQVSCRDRQHEILGARVQALVSRLVPGHDRILDEILRLEYVARSGEDEFGLQSLVRRAKANREQLDLTGKGRLFLISLSTFQSPAPQVAWLFPAIELHWFEEIGYHVALINSNPAEMSWQSEEIPESQHLEQHYWTRLYFELVYRPLYEPYDSRLPKSNGQNRETFLTLAGTLRNYTLALLSDEYLSPKLMDIVHRWCKALRWDPWDLDALRAATRRTCVLHLSQLAASSATVLRFVTYPATRPYIPGRALRTEQAIGATLSPVRSLAGCPAR
jgi:transcriptional regulator with XRE-family HTH domain